MAVERERPYKNFNFLVDLGDGDPESFRSGFCEVILPEAVLDEIDYRPGNARELDAMKLSGLEHYTPLVLRRGTSGSLNLYQWYNAARNGDQNVQRNVTIHLMNEDRSQIVQTWRFLRARPIKYTSGPLNALSRQVHFESIELAFERMEME
jgi:phage tail-like protein